MTYLINKIENKLCCRSVDIFVSFLFNYKVSLPFTDGNRITVNVFGGEWIVAGSRYAQLPGWLRSIIKTFALQRNRRICTVDREHSSIFWCLTCSLCQFPPTERNN